jgi:hypothetical protein
MRSPSSLVASCLLVLALASAGELLAQPAIQINNLNATEGNAGSADAVLTVSLTAAATSVVTVAFATEDNGATGGAACGGSVDYVTESGTVQFDPGETSQPVGVSVCGDVVDEANENVRIRLSNAVGATIQDQVGRITIVDDDAPAALPSLSIGDATVVEEDAGTTGLSLTATLSAASTQAVTVGFASVPLTAVQGASCGAGIDLATAQGGLLFNPGVTSQPLVVAVCGDVVDEPDETFDVVLSNPVGATIADGTGRGTITDDDAAAQLPSISINDVTVEERTGPTTGMGFTVTLSTASTQTVTVQFATTAIPPLTQGIACTAGIDLASQSGTVVFSPGVTSTTRFVTACGDAVVEGTEVFDAVLSSPVGAAIADGTGRGTITDDDVPGDDVTGPTVEDLSVDEGTGPPTVVQVPVTLPAPSAALAIARFNLVTTAADASATLGACASGADLPSITTDVTFSPGETTKNVAVTICGDALIENDERITMSVTQTTPPAPGFDTAFLTIRNDDFTPTLTINDVTFLEGSAVNAILTVSLLPPAPAAIQITPSTAPFSGRLPRTAPASSGTVCGGPADFRALVAQFPIPAGATSVSIPVQICDDAIDEELEGLSVTIQPVPGLTIGDGVGIIRITDND